MTNDARNATQVATSDPFEALCDLLSAQIVLAREGDFVQVEQLCERADGLVTQMKETGADRSLTKAQRTHLEKLYEELTLALRVEQVDVGARLKQLRRVKRAVSAYGQETKLRSDSHAGDPGVLDDTEVYRERSVSSENLLNRTG